jgi:hypothetical protein
MEASAGINHQIGQVAYLTFVIGQIVRHVRVTLMIGKTEH